MGVVGLFEFPQGFNLAKGMSRQSSVLMSSFISWLRVGQALILWTIMKKTRTTEHAEALNELQAVTCGECSPVCTGAGVGTTCSKTGPVEQIEATQIAW